MRFVKGKSGNPAGRPRRSGRTQDEIRKAIDKDILRIIAALTAQALAGDVQAAKVLLDRVCPTLKQVEVTGDRDTSQAVQVEVVFVRPFDTPEEVPSWLAASHEAPAEALDAPTACMLPGPLPEVLPVCYSDPHDSPNVSGRRCSRAAGI